VGGGAFDSRCVYVQLIVVLLLFCRDEHQLAGSFVDGIQALGGVGLILGVQVW
jgi:hypothetical protein